MKNPREEQYPQQSARAPQLIPVRQDSRAGGASTRAALAAAPGGFCRAQGPGARPWPEDGRGFSWG